MSLDHKKNGENISEGNFPNIENKFAKLEQDFLKKYNIKKEKIEELYSFQATNQLDELKNQLQTLAIESKVAPEDVVAIHKNFQEIIHIREASKLDRSQLSREIMRNNVEQIVSLKDGIITSKLSATQLARIENPQNIIDELYATAIMSLETLGWSAKLFVDFIAGIFLFPRDVIAYVRKKKEIDFSDI